MTMKNLQIPVGDIQIMKRYALRFVSGPNEGKFVGNNPTKAKTISVSKINPRIWTSKSAIDRYLQFNVTLYNNPKIANRLRVIPLWLVEEDMLPFKVDIIESERGWGAKVDHTVSFITEEEADAYVEDYNTKYNPPLKLSEVPDWYMYAKRRGF